MKTVDERLRAAAAETREYATRQWPPAVPTRTEAESRPKAWLVFVGAFAAVIIAFAALPMLLGTDQPDTASQPDPLVAPSTSSPTTVAGTASSDCSAAGAPLPGPIEGLPAAVAETRAAIIDAAVRCDVDALVDLAGPGFVTTFGGGDAENFRIWEQEGEGRLGTLLTILSLSHGTESDGEGGTIYAWPAAFTYDSREEIPDEAMEELSALYSEEELDQIFLIGAYGGWRTGIHEDGDWMYFVAGD